LQADGSAPLTAPGSLGLAWGVGHATTLFAFGLPILLLDATYRRGFSGRQRPRSGFVIVYLAVRLLVRWRRGEFRFHAHPQTHGARTRRGAFAIGLVHGMGGSASVGVLILASARSTGLAVMSLVVFAVFTVVSMTVVSRGFGLLLASRRARASLAAVAPVLGRCKPGLRRLVRNGFLEPRSVSVLAPKQGPLGHQAGEFTGREFPPWRGKVARAARTPHSESPEGGSMTDHNSSPRGVAEPAVDICDLYVFPAHLGRVSWRSP